MLEKEKKIIKKAKSGNREAFGQLYDTYHSQIYRFVILKVSSKEDAEDITHQVFLSAWQSMEGYEDQGHPFSSWLYKLARNQVIDYYRANKQEVSIDEILPEVFVAPAVADFEIDRAISMDNVQNALSELPPDYQDVIIMRFINELSVEETAKAMDRTDGAVKQLQRRAVNELRKILNSE